MKKIDRYKKTEKTQIPQNSFMPKVQFGDFRYTLLFW